MFIARLIAQRFLLALFTLLLVSFLIFAVLEILPGDVATRILGRDATPETLAALRDRMHLGDPALLRYGRIPGIARVRSYPLRERNQILWIWIGATPDEQPADEPPEYAVHDDPAYRWGSGAFHYEAPYQQIGRAHV